MRDDRLRKALSTESRLSSTRFTCKLYKDARRSSTLYSAALTRTGGTQLHNIVLSGDIYVPRTFPTSRARASKTSKTRRLGGKSDKMSIKPKHTSATSVAIPVQNALG